MLSQHQLEKQQEIIDHIIKGERIIVLEGSAGTGKTYMVNYLIEKIKKDFYKYGVVYVTAPTHKALSVLKSKIEPKQYVEFKTVHSGLQLKRKIIDRQEVYVKPEYTKKQSFERGVLLIIDESSMIGNKKIKNHPGMMDLIEELKDRMIIIFLGDRKQLPPVNESSSPVFTKGYPIVTLTEIQRQKAGNPIIDLSNNLSLIKTKEENIIKVQELVKQPITQLDLFTKTEEEDKYVEKILGYTFSNDRQRIISRLAETNGTNQGKYLAYTNDDVDEMNNQVRRAIYGNPAKIEYGEMLIFKAPYGENMNNDELIVSELEIKEIELEIPTEKCTFIMDDTGISISNIYQIHQGKNILDIDGKPLKNTETKLFKVYLINKTIPVIHEDSELEFNKECRKVERLCNSGVLDFKATYYMRDLLANITYGHASTVHKSQGSTYTKAFVNIANIKTNRNKSEVINMVYTAITRASDLVILYNVK